MVYNWLKKIQNSLYPPTCLLCGAPGLGSWDICEDCLDALPRLLHGCAHCAVPLPPDAGAVCGTCQQAPPAYDSVLAFFEYEPPIDHLITRLKFNGKLEHARLLGELMSGPIARHCEADGTRPDRIIPVPLHPSRLRERGFNQALEIARPIASRLEVPLDYRSVTRVRATDAQMGLPAKQRRDNIRAAFAVKDGAPLRRVAVVDDVMTTGSTVNEIAKVLKRAGVEHVAVWACARVGDH